MMARRDWQVRARTQPFWPLIIFAGLCLLLGGASQGAMAANAMLQLGAAALLAFLLWRNDGPARAGAEHSLSLIAMAAAAWIAFMFLPLPPALWTHLPGRDFIARGYTLLDIPLPWLATALAPDRALRSATALLVPLAAYLLARRVGLSDQRRVLAVVGAMAVVSAGLGLAQLATGPESGLRLYRPTNTDSPVGFFSNTNHFAVLLAASLPLTAAWVATHKLGKKPKRNHVIGFALLAAFVAFVLLLGRSVAGTGLMLLALIGSVWIIWGRFIEGRSRIVFAGGIAAASVLALAALLAIGSGTIGAKFQPAPTSRAQLTPVTLSAAQEFAPTGAGLGSFAQTFAMHQPDAFTSSEWVNHAHNDYAEIFLELGWPGLLLVAAFLVWFAMQGIAIWRRRRDSDMLIPQAAWLSATLLLLHSMVDYPLRTAALAGLFAILVGFVARAGGSFISADHESERTALNSKR